MGKAKISQEINEDVERMPTSSRPREGKNYSHSKTLTISNDEDDSNKIPTRNRCDVKENNVVIQFQNRPEYDADMIEEEIERRLKGPLNPVIVIFVAFMVIITIILVVQKGMKWLC